MSAVSAPPCAPTGIRPAELPEHLWGLSATVGSDEVFPLPLPEPGGWGVDQARAALAAASDDLTIRLGSPFDGEVEVVSALTTVVLRCAEHAVKVYPPGTDAEHLRAGAAAVAGSPVVLLPEVEPVPTPFGVVTVTRWVPAAPPVGWSELGALLRQLHTVRLEAPLPTWTPLSRLPSQVVGLSPEHREVLLGARRRLLSALEQLEYPVGVGVIHGDPSPGNALRTSTGARLIDLDWVALGPCEYDLAAAARRVRDGTISQTEYAGFCSAYGHDVSGWPGLVVLDQVADLGGVAFRLWDDRTHGRPLDWVADEVALWRGRQRG